MTELELAWHRIVALFPFHLLPVPSASSVLGALMGAQLLLVVLSMLIANAYRDRGLLVHAAGVTLGVVVIDGLVSPLHSLASAGLLGVMGFSAMHVQGLTTHVGSLRPFRRWMSATSMLLAALALLATVVREPLLLVLGAFVLFGLDAAVLPRAWPQSKPWALWVIAGQGALLVAGLLVGLPGLPQDNQLLLGVLLAFWSMAIYLASVWRSRVFGERRWQQAAERHEDPLTGLATAAVLGQRVQLARSLMRRHGHPSSLLLVHVDELARIANELGAQRAEAATLEAGLFVRSALGRADVAGRIGQNRFAILSEGSSTQEAAAHVATRIVSAGLREPLHSVEGAFLHFRIVVAELPIDDASVPALLQSLGERLDADVVRRSERRIHILPAEDLVPPVPTEPLPMPSPWTTKTN
ncbi:MAG: GGDEF domain-containing protein [Ramlibacter sp.]